MVSFDTTTGTPSQVRSTLLQRISAYTRQNRIRQFKIGITNHPDRRYSQAYADEYDEMIVIYETSSINHVSTLEAALIEHNWEFTDNQVGGGGGNIGDPPYFLYVVLRY
ncbi:MAG: GIY-YIG nuclease family protein [Nitrosomonadales bacterium]|nr:GIY-YIG nuclease family protein [Nitrosomonadales bacterium]